MSNQIGKFYEIRLTGGIMASEVITVLKKHGCVVRASSGRVIVARIHDDAVVFGLRMKRLTVEEIHSRLDPTKAL